MTAVEGEIFDRETEVIVGDVNVSALQVQFSVSKDIEKDPNSCDITISNLSETTRAQISGYNARDGKNRTIPVRISAGYKSLGGSHLIFEGQLRTTSSTKTGPTWKTTIKSGDGEMSTRIARVKHSFSIGTQPLDVVRHILGVIGLGQGNLASVAPALVSGGEEAFSIQGPASYHLDNWTRPFGVEWSIRNGAPYFSLLNQATDATVVKLTPDSGLIGSPVSESNGEVSCSARIIPGLDIGNVFVLDSESASGNFKIIQCKFSGNTRGPDYQVRLVGRAY